MKSKGAKSKGSGFVAWSGCDLSLSLSLCAWVRKWFEVKIFTSNHFRVKAIKTHGQLKIFSGKFIFHAQPNTHIYGKAFLEVIWSQNKHSLNFKFQLSSVSQMQVRGLKLYKSWFIIGIETLTYVKTLKKEMAEKLHRQWKVLVKIKAGSFQVRLNPRTPIEGAKNIGRIIKV